MNSFFSFFLSVSEGGGQTVTIDGRDECLILDVVFPQLVDSVIARPTTDARAVADGSASLVEADSSAPNRIGARGGGIRPSLGGIAVAGLQIDAFCGGVSGQTQLAAVDDRHGDDGGVRLRGIEHELLRGVVGAWEHLQLCAQTTSGPGSHSSIQFEIVELDKAPRGTDGGPTCWEKLIVDEESGDEGGAIEGGGEGVVDRLQVEVVPSASAELEP